MSNAIAHFIQKEINNDVVDNLDLLRIFLHDNVPALVSKRNDLCPSESQWFHFFNSQKAWQTDPEQ